MTRFNPYAKGARRRKATPRIVPEGMTGQVLGRKGPDLWVRIKGAMGAIVVPAATTAMLAFGGVTPAQATSYFTGVTTTTTTSLSKDDGIVDIKLDRLSNTGATTATRSSTAYDAVVFDPTAYLNKTYSSLTWVQASEDTSLDADPYSSTYTANTTILGLPTLTLTFNSGDNAASISKDALTQYTTAATSFTVQSTGYPGGEKDEDITVATGTAYTSSSTSAYTANLVFNGQNEVSGTTDIDGGSIDIKGAAQFGGNVSAGSIDINTTSAVTFNDAVNLSEGTTDLVKFYNAGNVTFNDGLTGNIDYNGQDAVVTLSNGSVSGYVNTSVAGSGRLVFGDSSAQSVSGAIGSTGALRQIDLNGTGAVTFSSTAAVDNVEFGTATTLTLSGNLSTSSRSGNIDFNNHAGTVSIASGVTGYANIISTGGTNGTVAFANGGASWTGNIGDTTNAISSVSVGTGSVDLTGNLYASSTAIDGALNVNSGDISGAINGTSAGHGSLTLQGGTGANGVADTQVVSGVIGGTNSLAEINAGANGYTTNFTNASAVNATTLNVTGTGTVNLSGGLSGALDFDNAGTAGTATVASGKTITGNVSTTNDNTGILTLSGGSQSLSGTVGASGKDLFVVNAGATGATTSFTNAAAVYANTLNVTGTGSVSLAGGLVGNLDYDDAGTTGYVTVASGKSLTGVVTTQHDNTGILTLSGGSQTVSGAVGASSADLYRVDAGASSSATSTFSGTVYANTLQFTGNGTVNLNGTAGAYGTVDFGTNATNTGTLGIGNGVNLAVASEGIQFADANAATLSFAGASTVTGVLGAAATGTTAANSTLKYIKAGAGAVSFGSDVYVADAGYLEVNGTGGTVALQGDLYGALKFTAAGTVSVADGKSIRNDATAADADVSTATTNTGTLNFLGSTTLYDHIGASDKKLAAVTFHSDAGVASLSQTIDKSIYASTTTFGANTTVNITDNVYLGGNVVLADDTVVLNTAGAVAASSISPVDFLYTTNSDGTLASIATVTRSTFDDPGDAFETNGATLNFTVASSAWNDASGGGVIDADASSSITGPEDDSWLDMDGDETVNLTLLGSLRNGTSYSLIDVDDYGSETDGVDGIEVNDNSYVIDTILSRATDGDLVVTADRDANTYVTKSATSGHYSNDAAVVLGTLAAAGTGYSADMQTVLNMLDIDQWGYGNTEANLAEQVKSLAPIANNSVSEASFAANTLALRAIGDRIDGLRSDIRPEGGAKNVQEAAGLWVKGYSGWLNQKADGMYDGYDATTWGTAVGTDYRVSDCTVLGVAFAYSNTDLDQNDFRTGDSMTIEGLQGSLYGSVDLGGHLYIDAQAACTFNSYDGERSTAVGRTASSEFDGTEWSGRLGAGYRISLADNHVLTPMVGAEVSQLKLDGYTETGAGALDLEIDGRTLNSTRSLVGMRYTASARVSDHVKINPELSATWYHEFSDRSEDVVASYEGGGADFTTAVSSVNDDMLNASFGLNAQIGGDSNVALRYDFDATDSSTNHEMQLQYRYSF